MNVDIYKAKIEPSPREKQYVLVPAGSDIDILPPDVREQLGELVFFKNLTLVPGKPRIAVDPLVAIQNIENNGYHIQITKVVIQVNTASYNIL